MAPNLSHFIPAGSLERSDDVDRRDLGQPLASWTHRFRALDVLFQRPNVSRMFWSRCVATSVASWSLPLSHVLTLEASNTQPRGIKHVTEHHKAKHRISYPITLKSSCDNLAIDSPLFPTYRMPLSGSPLLLGVSQQGTWCESGAAPQR